jgi:O-antigen/teichoic acid export membrane protein
LRRLLQSGFLLSAAGLLSGVGNTLFQAVIGRRLSIEDYGLVNSSLALVSLLSLPLSIASYTVTHYLARFNAVGEESRLRGLLAGCRKILFWVTLAGSLLAAVLVKPVSDFFHFPHAGVVMVVLVCVLATLWGSFGAALCQGFAWFKRLAFVTFLTAVLRLCFAAGILLVFPRAEWAVLASAVGFLSYLLLLFWRRELPRRAEAISTLDREFFLYFIVSAACVGGGYFFTTGDLLVANRYFSHADMGAYSAAERLAAALPLAVAPLLTVLFTHRSGEHAGSALREQLKYLGLYAAGLLFGATVLLSFRSLWLALILGKAAPASEAMIGRLALTMVFVGLLQALALWALASRWLKLALLYGALGSLYWLILLCFGKSPAQLLWAMPACTGLALAILFIAWLLAMRHNTANEGLK